MNHESSFDGLNIVETTGPKREQPRHARALLRASPAPEPTLRRRKAPRRGVVRLRQRRGVKRRALLLLAAALSVAAVFVSGAVVGDQRGGRATSNAVVRTLALRGTSLAPHARARLEISQGRDGNWPMTLSVVGLPKLPPHTYYEVDLVRSGKPWGSDGMFLVASASRAITLMLNSPYVLRKGDSWVVTRQAVGREGGVTVLRPV